MLLEDKSKGIAFMVANKTPKQNIEIDWAY